MTDDKCREAFEAWCEEHASGWGRFRDGYTPDTVQWAWVAWKAAWKPSPSVSREGWLTAEEIDHLVEINNHYEPGTDEVQALCDMARAAIRLHTERAALFTQLKAAIEIVERGNV